MIAKNFMFILALLAICIMFSPVSSHPLTEEEQQKLFNNPFLPKKDEKQNPSPPNEVEKPNSFKNLFPAGIPTPNVQLPPYSTFPPNEGEKPNYFKNPFPNGIPAPNVELPPYFTFPPNEGGNPNPKNPFPTGIPAPNVQLPPDSTPGFNYWFTRYNPRATQTCDKFPRVCREKGSPGPDCCKKNCVNVMTDNFNCGECGKRCRFGQTCCGGTCTNVFYDQKNCGTCKTKCKKGSFCNFGMCSYA